MNKLAIYIHWPFCKSKCPYCDFNSYVRADVDQAEWLKSYIKELRYYRDKLGTREIVSIFFGGGTPSLMDVSTLEAILGEINTLWNIPKDIEITIEANPTSVEVEKFKGFKTAGVNRVSIGVQSLRDDALKELGREHSAADALLALKTAASVFDRYSFDLIYARQNQTLECWGEELQEAIKYSNGHMSLYQLTIEQGTKYYSQYQKKELIIPEDDLASDMYELTQDLMSKNNMPAYEVSNHARKGEESQHNLVYWNYGDYIGIGAGAHGRITIDGAKLAIDNNKVPEQWLEQITNPNIEEVNHEQQLYERLMMGLRLTDGIKWDDDFAEIINGKNLQILIDENLVIRDNEYIKVTPSGMQKLNAVLGFMF